MLEGLAWDIRKISKIVFRKEYRYDTIDLQNTYGEDLKC
jgi:hypothetical protein